LVFTFVIMTAVWKTILKISTVQTGESPVFPRSEVGPSPT
jgi:hypothetical protein